MFSISPKKCMLLRSKVAISFQNHLLNTQWKMRNLILLAVILHLAIIIKEINGQVLGDIISYERTCPCIGAVIYKHFAIFRGGPNTDQNIFHHTRNPDQCAYGKINAQGVHEIENYLDGMPTITIGNEAEIQMRINEMRENCGEYNLLRNNCEHLATYVRYGIRRSEQRGTLVEWFARRLCQRGLNSCPILDEKWKKVLEYLDENAKRERECNACRNSGR
ncbi:uncharacterized protein LOC115789778 isoform X1 [Archocentrus centrarchus]|uniref:uncharacterized protein LOC115789778 isoform X1 n=1 Tax=Archocentrus centrarchus TaxID=63155 RepID=UPI0011EA0C52|nr:uncharacterized protein LOC115789778 isoform X1 [Archocentrus centrarchus]